RQEYYRMFEQLRHRVHGVALEEQELPRRKLRLGGGVRHPESAASREHVEILVASGVIMSRSRTVDPKHARASLFPVREILIHQKRRRGGGEFGGYRRNVEPAVARRRNRLSILVSHGRISYNLTIPAYRPLVTTLNANVVLGESWSRGPCDTGYLG